MQVLWLIKLVSNLVSHPKPSRYLGSGNQYFVFFSWSFFLHNCVCVWIQACIYEDICYILSVAYMFFHRYEIFGCFSHQMIGNISYIFAFVLTSV